ncbi:Xanthine/uracil permease [Piromyces finnis]|uniref:Xanthine/uracil permease n=1 Tax=Piromyces finnis TaxID=1754191 RepID=A0A1Y1UVV4_9FUNG|nr:Xanthine/uracil permease [Piromyces finnis]|eukprot:ORX42206.1 Xanthine/uracil permease [Piromyces finnis]
MHLFSNIRFRRRPKVDIVDSDEIDDLPKSKPDISNNSEPIYDARQLGIVRMIILGFQHLFAMFGATVLVPTLTGLNVSTTLLFTGLGTLLFHLVSQRKIPAFLGSSFSFLSGYFSIAPHGEKELLPYACFGVLCAGVIYIILAIIIKFCGIKRIMKFFPPIVTGPIIIAIGLTLSQSAINNCSKNWLLAVIAVIFIISCNIWGKGLIRIIPGVISITLTVAIAALLTLLPTKDVDGFICINGNENFRLFSTSNLKSIIDVNWVGLPIKKDSTILYVFEHPDASKFLTAFITIVPISIATIVEHIGDISAISSTCNRNYLANPGLHRTIMGDGLATILASIFGAPANTTYGENTGVLTISKVFDPLVLQIAAFIAILLSFSPKIAACISSIPNSVVGGVSLVLYGMISAVGVRNIVENKIQFRNTRNIILAGLILILSIGITYSDKSAIIIPIGSVEISLSGLATGSLVGIIVNAILPGKDYIFNDENDENEKSNEPVEVKIEDSKDLSNITINANDSKEEINSEEENNSEENNTSMGSTTNMETSMDSSETVDDSEENSKNK